MKVSVSEIAVIGLKLFIICAASAVILSLLNTLTAPRIEKNRIEQQKEALEYLVTTGGIGEKHTVDDETVTSVYTITQGSDVTGYVLELRGYGYGDPMTLLALYATDGELKGAKLMENTETPGLGKKAESDEYMKKFIGKGGTVGPPIPTTIELLKAQTGASGATAYSEVAVTSVNDVLLKVFEWFFGKPKTGASDSVTGATITFQGVSRALAGGSDYVKEKLGGGK
ncbi:MAG: FMN-binding protein [Spirochaetales bacterium]|nr:FMN-binding protein [Spirochaetales bacterium]